MVRYCKLVWGNEEQSLLMTKNGKFVVEEAVRFNAPDLYLCDTFVDAVSCLCNLKWSIRFHWSEENVQIFLDTVHDIIENWEGEEDEDSSAREFPITTVKELRELKELACWDINARSFDYRDKKTIEDKEIETSDVECYGMCAEICSQELREEYLAKHGCICGACSKNCKCYKNKECDAPDEE